MLDVPERLPGDVGTEEPAFESTEETRRLRERIHGYLQRYGSRSLDYSGELAWRHHRYLLLGENHSEVAEVAAYAARLLRSAGRAGDIVVCEVGVAHQDAVDAYLRGDAAPFARLAEHERTRLSFLGAAAAIGARVLLVDARTQADYADSAIAFSTKWDVEFLDRFIDGTSKREREQARFLFIFGKAHALWRHAFGNSQTGERLATLLANSVGIRQVFTASLYLRRDNPARDILIHSPRKQIFGIGDLFIRNARRAVMTGLRDSPFFDCSFFAYDDTLASSADLIGYL